MTSVATFDEAERDQFQNDNAEFEFDQQSQKASKDLASVDAKKSLIQQSSNQTQRKSQQLQQQQQQQQLVFSGQMEEQRRVYDFMTEHDIPKFVDKICQHLLRTTPSDPAASVISMLTGLKNGQHHGGAAIAGHNVHGGWIRCFSPDGRLRASINQLKNLPCCTHELLNNQTVDQGLAADPASPGQPTPAVNTSGSALSGPSAIGTSLMACALGERAIYVICSPPEGSSQTLIDLPSSLGGGGSSSFSAAAGGGSGGGASGGVSSASSGGVLHFVCKFSTDSGQLLRAMCVPRQPITLHVDRERGYVWVGYRHGGVGILHARGGNNILGDIHTPMALALHATPTSTGSVWILTPRQIERRQWETGQLLMSIDLPNMLNSWPCSFSVAKQHLYVGAPNPDGTAAFVGMFDAASGEPLRSFVPAGTGCLLSADQTLGGVWLLQRGGGSSAVAVFHSDYSGVKTMNCEVGRANKAIAFQVDQSSSRLWVAKVSLSEDSRLMLIDPFRSEIFMEATLPSCVSGTCPSICAL